MNEFVEQFLIEGRELVERAVDDMLALEQAPRDAGRLDSAFRAFHTLKGGAGIVDFDAMARALHSAEDLLGAARAGDEQVTPRLIGDCLAALDQVSRWFDEMEATGEIPADAEARADEVALRFARDADADAGVRGDIPASWLPGLVSRHGGLAAAAHCAVRYAPDEESFFRDEDPLALLAGLPGLLAVEAVPVEDGPTLDELDPFRCHLVFFALTSHPAGEIAAALQGVRTQVDISELDAASSGDAGWSAPARAVLEAQIELLREQAPEGRKGRLASVARVAANVLRHAERPGEAEQMERLSDDGGAGVDPQVMEAALRRLLAGNPDASGPAPVKADEEEAALAPAGTPVAPRDVAALSLRVDVERIDALVKLTDELTVVKNAVGHAAGLAQDPSGPADPKALAALLKENHTQLDRLVGELQRSVLGIRVLPLRHVFQRFPRLVREMGVSLGKPAVLVTEGDGTEADKAIVEGLFEPLLHVLRNAIDHGLETPRDRAALGKPATATIRLRGARDGEHVHVEVADDGRGIDVDRVRRLAEERGLAAPDAVAAMSDEEAIELIFAPGFSTSASVTDLSGRGVGMDAVRNAVGQLGGRVSVESRRGEGTLVRFTLPFTVMITRVMTVEAGGQLFGVPLEAVLETVRVPRDRLVGVGGMRAIVLRDRTVPVVDLASVLGTRPEEADQPSDARILVTASGGLEVDRVGERMDVVLKPMGGLLSGMPGIAGTTLLGDGRVLIVLDLQEFIR